MQQQGLLPPAASSNPHKLVLHATKESDQEYNSSSSGDEEALDEPQPVLNTMPDEPTVPLTLGLDQVNAEDDRIAYEELYGLSSPIMGRD